MHRTFIPISQIYVLVADFDGKYIRVGGYLIVREGAEALNLPMKQGVVFHAFEHRKTGILQKTFLRRENA
jgi:hypothetical protein